MNTAALKVPGEDVFLAAYSKSKPRGDGNHGGSDGGSSSRRRLRDFGGGGGGDGDVRFGVMQVDGPAGSSASHRNNNNTFIRDCNVHLQQQNVFHVAKDTRSHKHEKDYDEKAEDSGRSHRNGNGNGHDEPRHKPTEQWQEQTLTNEEEVEHGTRIPRPRGLLGLLTHWPSSAVRLQMPSRRCLGLWGFRILFVFLVLVVLAMLHVSLGDLLGPRYNRAISVAVGWVQGVLKAFFYVVVGRQPQTAAVLSSAAAVEVTADTSPFITRGRDDFIMPSLDGLDTVISDLLHIAGRRSLGDVFEQQRRSTIQAARHMDRWFAGFVGHVDHEAEKAVASLRSFQAGVSSSSRRRASQAEEEAVLGRLRWMSFSAWVSSLFRPGWHARESESLRWAWELQDVLLKRRDTLSDYESPSGLEDRQVPAGTLQQVAAGICHMSAEGGKWHAIPGTGAESGGGANVAMVLESSRKGGQEAEFAEAVVGLQALCKAMRLLESRHEELLRQMFKEGKVLDRIIEKLQRLQGDMIRSSPDMQAEVEAEADRRLIDAAAEHLEYLEHYYMHPRA